MKHYQQLTQEQRYQIYGLRKAGFNQTGIANEIGADKSTVCRELKRNRGQRGARSRLRNCAIDVVGHVATPSDLIGNPGTR